MEAADWEGLTHVYYGNGKGKTTSALGMALRASGQGLKVVIVQFLKNAPTGELVQFSGIPNVRVIRGTAGGGFVRAMSDEQKEKTRKIQNDNLREAIRLVEMGQCDMLVLDEVLDAYQLDMLDGDLLRSIVCNKPEGLELVITGHEPIDWIMDKADYITEMKKWRHPFDKGVEARKGVEM
ncbi:MAG: cob(I)yrinic acid a,c-diamide adenosyltransferase [Coriobacteriales bacterium]|jgi:cob(I)alamin adenosyltransferase